MKRQGFFAAALLALHLLVVSMAMSPALHHWLHHDSDAPDHACAVTMMLDGQIDRPDMPDLNVALATIPVELRKLAEPQQSLPTGLASSHDGRAPPVA